MGKNKYRAGNDILHLIEEGYQKLASSISKKLEEITNSNHVSSIAPKKTPNKFVDTDFPSYQSTKKQHKLHVISTSLQTRPSQECSYSNKKQQISNTRRHNNYMQWWNNTTNFIKGGKVLERIVIEQTMEFLDKHNILYKFQSGFWKNHSTGFYLSYLTDKISKGFDSGLLTGMILIDLQKAFDTIDHNILLLKMPSLGFSHEVIDCYKSNLSGRKFHVNFRDKFSTSADLRFGVPQGSILGPLLFLLYLNHMQQAVDCDLFLYADDTCLLF